MSITLASLTPLAARAATAVALWLQPMQQGGAPAPSGGAAPAGGAPAGGAGGIWGTLIPLVLFVGFFYFAIIRPGNKQREDQQKLLSSLMKGDRVVTSGGMLATVSGVDGDEVVLEIAEKVKVRFKREAIASKISAKTDKPASKSESPASSK
ncbi:MAG: preprotein translocase subunit YajC [Myxococcales bacterium]|nr:preprotein translocase subunit YajC [Myxococcales bacterium]